MEPLVFSINAIMPLILLTVLGIVLKRIGVIPRGWPGGLNKICYNVLLPVLLFNNVYSADGLSDINWGLTAFAAVCTLIAYALGLAASRFISGENRRGVLIQSVFRSNYAILGTPLAISLCGDAGGRATAALSLFSIPLFNTLSVIALQDKNSRSNASRLTIIKDTALSIIKNPMIIGVFIGLLMLIVRMWFIKAGIAFRFSDIGFLHQTLLLIGGTVSPMALISLGAEFDLKSAKGSVRPIVMGAVLKLAVVPVIAIGFARLLFSNLAPADYAALVALFASPVSVSSLVIAQEMGGDEQLAGQLVFWTTSLSAFTVFIAVTLLRAARLL